MHKRPRTGSIVKRGALQTEKGPIMMLPVAFSRLVRDPRCLDCDSSVRVAARLRSNRSAFQSSTGVTLLFTLCHGHCRVSEDSEVMVFSFPGVTTAPKKS